jgi:PAS domain S-box-containing protein
MKRADLIGQGLLGFVAKEDETVYYTHLRKLVNTKNPQICEIRMNRQDGSPVWVSLHGTFVRSGREKANSYRIAIINITERKRAEDMVHTSEIRYRRLFESAKDGILILDAETGMIMDVNPFLVELLGYSYEMFLGKTVWDIGFLKDIIGNKDKFLQLQQKEYVRYENLPLETAWGKSIEVEFVSNVYEADHKKVIQCNIRDITLRKIAEEKIKSLLAEKELLLKEVHHRIKNNMSTMMSLLLLQSKAQKNPEAGKALKDAMNRLQSMEVLYEKLYRSEDFREISIKDYLPPLINEIVGTFPHKNKVTMETEMADLVLSARILSPLGIIMNELITNSMKYAFVGRDEGVIKVSVSLNNNRAILVFEDNGNGVPPSVDIENSTGFGLQLVDMLAKQLKGSIRLERQQGAQFILEFEV